MSRVDDIVAALVGSQSTIDHLLTADELKDPQRVQQLTQDVFFHIAPCVDCDYWFELEELNRNSQCGSCEVTA